MTLRKRYNNSSLRRSRSRGGDNHSAGPSSALPLSASASGEGEIPADAAAVVNPWGDLRGGPSTTARTARRTTTNSTPLHHRLSFDHGSGVIMLPDDAEDWLDLDDDVDSDEEEHPHHHNDDLLNSEGNDLNGGGGGGGLEQSIASLASTDSTAATPGMAVAMGVSSPSRTSRYGTYFHHPERRRERQSIPGAFPR